MNYWQDDWADWLATTEFQYNDKVHSATGHTPFWLNYGQHPWKGMISSTSPTPAVTEFVQNLEKARYEAMAHIKESQEAMSKQYNQKRRGAHRYTQGDKVWLEATNIRTN